MAVGDGWLLVGVPHQRVRAVLSLKFGFEPSVDRVEAVTLGGLEREGDLVGEVRQTVRRRRIADEHRYGIDLRRSEQSWRVHAWFRPQHLDRRGRVIHGDREGGGRVRRGRASRCQRDQVQSLRHGSPVEGSAVPTHAVNSVRLRNWGDHQRVDHGNRVALEYDDRHLWRTLGQFEVDGGRVLTAVAVG